LLDLIGLYPDCFVDARKVHTDVSVGWCSARECRGKEHDLTSVSRLFGDHTGKMQIHGPQNTALPKGL
jgi:hypothetical protein